MKKYLIVFITAISLSFFVGCEDADDDFNPPNYVTFETGPLSLPVNENSSESLEVTIYTANTTGSDRTFTINVGEASTLSAAAYTLPSTVVVPANSNEATFTVDVSDNELSDTGNTLVLTLGSPDGTYTGSNLTINVSRLCEIDVNEYIGQFTGTGSWSELFGYTTEVETFLNEDGEVMINGLLFQWVEGWWGEVIVSNTPVRIDINEETGAITIPEQPYITTTYEGDLQPAYSIKGTGVVNACDRSLVIRPVLVQNGTEFTGTNWNGGVRFVETIRIDPNAGGETDGGGTDGEDGDTDGEDGDGDTDGDDGDGDDTDGSEG